MNETQLSASLNSFAISAYLTTVNDSNRDENVLFNRANATTLHLSNESSSPVGSVCEFYGSTENYIVITVFLSIFLLSVIGNAMVILVILKQRTMRSITNIYLMNLAITDLMLSVVCMPPTLASMVMNCWLFGNLMCKLFAYLQPMVVTASAYTLAVIAFERYFAICKPLHSRIWQTRSHAYVMISVVWFIALTANLLLLFMYEARDYETPSGNGIMCTPIHPPVYHFAYQVYMTIVLCVVPLLVMTALYGTVINTLKSGMKMEIAAVENSEGNDKESLNDVISVGKKLNMFEKLQQKMNFRSSQTRPKPEMDHRRSEVSMSENNLRSTHNQKSVMAKQRVIKMLLVVVFIFFCCWTPSYIWWLLLMAGDSFAKLGLDVWNPDVNTVITLLTYLSSCTNPITYCFLNKKFRTAVYTMFGRKKAVRHHFQKVYFPVSTASPLVGNNNDAQQKHVNINRSISTNCNLQQTQIVVSERMKRSSSNYTAIPSHQCLLRHDYLATTHLQRTEL